MPMFLFLVGKNAPDWHMSPLQRLGKNNHIRFDIPVFHRKKTAGASQASLNFVGNK